MKTKKLRKYASDQSNYKKIIQLYEEKAEGEKLFLFNITMQNHGGYDEENYESSVSLTEYAGQFPQTEQFLSLMQESDKAFHELLEYFSQVEEDTVILLFGDHQPSLEDDFYEQVMEPETPENFLSRYQKRFLTPYVLWANYDLKAEEEKYLSLNYLGSYLLDAIGLELPVYNRYLLNLQKKIPAINLNGFLDETYQMRGLPGDEGKEVADPGGKVAGGRGIPGFQRQAAWPGGLCVPKSGVFKAGQEEPCAGAGFLRGPAQRGLGGAGKPDEGGAP